MRRSLIAASIAAIATAGCGPSKEELERDAVIAGIDAVVAIPAKDVAARARAVDALRGTPATTPDALAARDLCAKAFGALAEGMRLTAAAEEGLRSGPGASEAAVKAATQAGPLLLGVDVDLDRCAESSAALRLRR